MPLSSTDQDRLAKLLAMFSSSHDGEVANAARMAEKLVKARGETWETVIKTGNHHQPPPNEQPQQQRKPPTWRDEVAECRCWPEHLTAWENEFLDSLSARTFSPTEKQRSILDRIKKKLESIRGMDW